MSETHDQLLDTAISAHEELIQATELLKVQRSKPFVVQLLALLRPEKLPTSWEFPSRMSER